MPEVTVTFTIKELPPPGYAEENVLLYWLVDHATDIRDDFGGPSQTDLMEAALCLWEDVLSNYRIIVESKLIPMTKEANFFCWWQGTGAANVRLHMIDFAEPCHEAWVLAHRDGDGFDAPFDWEFVPWFVHNCIDWTETGPELKSDWRELATKLGEK